MGRVSKNFYYEPGPKPGSSGSTCLSSGGIFVHLSLFRRHLWAGWPCLACLGLDPGAWLRALPLLYKPLHLPCRPQLNLKYYGDKNKFEIQNSISVWLTKTMVVFIINHYGSADIVKDQYSLTRRSRTFTSDSYLSSRCTVYPSY